MNLGVISIPLGVKIFPNDYEEVTVDATVRTVTAAKLNGGFFFSILFYDGPIRLFLHGPSPTATTGILVRDGDSAIFTTNEAQNLKMIRSGVVNGTLKCTYYGVLQSAYP